ncbi:MAG TPA: hypothetical protein QGH10_11365, partial [Armatimonadota bacterium]|nr:hypothetical protein [Armatimonadota bacterium]
SACPIPIASSNPISAICLMQERLLVLGGFQRLAGKLTHGAAATSLSIRARTEGAGALTANVSKLSRIATGPRIQ